MSINEKYKIMNENLLVIPIEEPEGTIIIPDTAKAITQKGRVVAVSDKGDQNIKIDDVVLYKKSLSLGIANWVELDGIKYLKMKKYDILGIMFGDDAVDVTPIKDYVFLEWEETKDMYSGTNLIRPEAFRKMHYTGKVVHVGPDVKEVVVGDRVFFDQFPGDRAISEKFVENGKRYTFIKEESIILKGLPERVEAEKEKVTV